MEFFLLLILILSVLQIIFPEQMVMLGRRWQFKEGTEPSEIYILLSRISAIVVIVVILLIWILR